MRGFTRQLTLAIILTTHLLLIAGCGGEDMADAREPVVRPVKMMTLSPASEVETRRFPAVVSAGQFSELSFQVGGLIEEVNVNEAQQVNEGEVIARLDKRDFQSQVASARAQFVNAEEEFQRAVRLAQEDAIARNVLEQREAQRDIAKATLDSAEKALEDTELLAPFSGVVVQVPARARENISAGQPVAALMGSGNMEVAIDIPARVVAESLEVEDRGSFVILEAAPDRKIPASFKEATLLADTASQTYSVTFDFLPPANLVVLPGMNATVELSSARRTDSARPDRISVPLSAITSDGTSKYVWLVDEDSMTVSRRDVTVADGIGESAVVTEGLEAGDIIATAGASFLADGMQVRPWTE